MRIGESAAYAAVDVVVAMNALMVQVKRRSYINIAAEMLLKLMHKYCSMAEKYILCKTCMTTRTHHHEKDGWKCIWCGKKNE